MRHALLLAALLAGPAVAREQDGEAALAETIARRVAGPATDCIEPRASRSTRIIGGTAIVYDIDGRLYVNRPQAGAAALRRDDVLVTRVDGGQLCRVDTVTLLDPVTRAQRGVVVLGDFVPYDLAR